MAALIGILSKSKPDDQIDFVNLTKKIFTYYELVYFYILTTSDSYYRIFIRLFWNLWEMCHIVKVFM